MKTYDVIIIGAGAAGLMCAVSAAKRRRNVLVIDHANKPGKKILMSGGGRCNFTNYNVSPEKYLSGNPHFCKSALSRYTQWDFIDWVKQYEIPFHEKAHGELFCDNKSKDILNLLLHECQEYNVTTHLEEPIKTIEKCKDNQFNIISNINHYICESLVIATGGLSIPSLGASPFGYKIAEQFGIKVRPTRAGLVPFTLHEHDKEKFHTLAGISCYSHVTCEKQTFKENILFTHRGLSGPAILQISNYWEPGLPLFINLLPETDVLDLLRQTQKSHPKRSLKETLSQHLPKRLIQTLLPNEILAKALVNFSDPELKNTSETLTLFSIKPNNTEGYRTAEVTLGGVDCNAISSKTMEATSVKGLFFIGEVLDVTGWLGGYNFQWAWSSGWAAGQVV